MSRTVRAGGTKYGKDWIDESKYSLSKVSSEPRASVCFLAHYFFNVSKHWARISAEGLSIFCNMPSMGRLVRAGQAEHGFCIGVPDIAAPG